MPSACTTWSSGPDYLWKNNEFGGLRFDKNGVRTTKVEREMERALASIQATLFKLQDIVGMSNRTQVALRQSKINQLVKRQIQNGKWSTRFGHQGLRSIGDGENTSRTSIGCASWALGRVSIGENSEELKMLQEALTEQ